MHNSHLHSELLYIKTAASKLISVKDSRISLVGAVLQEAMGQQVHASWEASAVLQVRQQCMLHRTDPCMASTLTHLAPVSGGATLEAAATTAATATAAPAASAATIVLALATCAPICAASVAPAAPSIAAPTAPSIAAPAAAPTSAFLRAN